MIRHKQLTLNERQEIGKYAAEYGINVAAKQFKKHYTTVKRWHDRFFNDEVLTNVGTTPLTAIDHKYLDSFSHLVGHNSLREIKSEFSLPYSIDTLAQHYRQQNIPIEQKHIIIYKCPNCKLRIRAINVFFGRPRNISCPSCYYDKLKRHEYFRFPFYNPRSKDFFINRSLLISIKSDIFEDTVLPLLKIPKDLKCLFLYNIKPRKFNRIHLIKYFEKIGDNTVPVTYCGVSYSKINKREILNPRSSEIDTDLICQNCQMPFLRDFNKYGNKYPNILTKSTTLQQTAIELFYLAQKHNIKIACTLLDISKKRFYSLKKQFPVFFEAIRYLNTNYYNANL